MADERQEDGLPPASPKCTCRAAERQDSIDHEPSCPVFEAEYPRRDAPSSDSNVGRARKPASIEGELVSIHEPGMGKSWTMGGEPLDLDALATKAGARRTRDIDSSFGRVRITVEALS